MQVFGDRRVITRDVLERLLRQVAAQLLRRFAPGQRFEDRRVIGGIDEHDHRREVLGGGAEQGYAADVDVLQRRVQVGAAGDGAHERVEVDGDQIDRAQAVPLQLLQVRGHITAGQQPAVDGRVQRLDAAAQDLREAGEVGDTAHGHAGSGDRRLGLAGAEDLGAEPPQPGRKLGDARLVVHAQDGAHGGVDPFDCALWARTNAPPRPIALCWVGFGPCERSRLLMMTNLAHVHRPGDHVHRAAGSRRGGCGAAHGGAGATSVAWVERYRMRTRGPSASLAMMQPVSQPSGSRRSTRSRSDGATATTMPTPMLNVRYISASGTLPARWMYWKSDGVCQVKRSKTAATPSGRWRGTLWIRPPPVMCPTVLM